MTIDETALIVESRSVRYVSGPLVFVSEGHRHRLGSIVEIIGPDGSVRRGQVLETGLERAVIQVLEDTGGLDTVLTSVRLKEETATVAVSPEMIGRIFTGSGRPRDGLPLPSSARAYPVEGRAINPAARARPRNFVQTGITAIDLFNTLVRGQKLPIFTGSGLPANELAAHIIAHAAVRDEGSKFVVVFGAIGLTQREISFFQKDFARRGSQGKTIAFINGAGDPTVERLLTPRCALTAAEILAFDHGYHVLVILSDMTNYCEALREVGSARDEIPGRRGYPGYMYTDLAMIYERSGRIQGREGSVTQIPILTMPSDDITHPIADLSGYITEGQIVLSRELHRLGVFPPVDVLSSLSRLMNNGIGEGATRRDHRELANQLYASYASGCDVRRLATIVGEEALGTLDQAYLEFARRFERELIGQGESSRYVEDSLDIGWSLLSKLPESELTRLSADTMAEFLCPITADGSPSPYLESGKER